MIDLANEKLLTFQEAAEWLPRRGRGNKVALSTLWRWAKWGVYGVRLETTRVGRAPVTSIEALQRFGNRLADREQRGAQTPVTGSERHKPKQDSDVAELDRHGW